MCFDFRSGRLHLARLNSMEIPLCRLKYVRIRTGKSDFIRKTAFNYLYLICTFKEKRFEKKLYNNDNLCLFDLIRDICRRNHGKDHHLSKITEILCYFRNLECIKARGSVTNDHSFRILANQQSVFIAELLSFCFEFITKFLSDFRVD